MSYRLGVDLGTTYTAAAVAREDGHVEIVALGNRAPVVPSVVFLREDESILTGEAASRRGVTEPARLARAFKRRVGDPTPMLLGGVPYSADALMAKLLRWVVDAVAEREGGPPDSVVVCHPANWGPYKLDLLRQAVRLAGLPEATLVSEPEAAAIHYATANRVDPGDVVAVYDLGGGTFDAAVLKRTESGWEILGAPEGIERLGGVDFDEAVFGHVRNALDGALDKVDPDDPEALAAVARLREACVEAKEALSSDTDAAIPVLLPGLHSEVRITRPEFEAMVRPALSDSLAALRRALESAGTTPEDVRAVLLVGGSSRIPIVARLVSGEFGRPVAVDAHPKHAVALGAAVAAREAGAAPATASIPTPELPAITTAPAAEPVPPSAGPATSDTANPSREAPDRRQLVMAAAALLVVLALIAVVARPWQGDASSSDQAAGTTTTTGLLAPAAAWRAIADAPTPRQFAASAVADGTIWVIGGLTANTSTTKVEGYDPAIDSWKAGPDLPLPLHHVSAVTYKGEVVVLGGWIPEGPNLTAIASDKVFALRGRAWVELPKLNRPRAAAAAAVVGDRIVVAGGQAAKVMIAETEVFDGTTWRDAAPIPTPREHLAAAADATSVYVVGGRQLSADKNSPAFERFDPASGKWEKLPNMPTPRGGLGVAIVGGRLVAVGGEAPTGVYDIAESYGIRTKTWDRLSTLTRSRHGMVTAVTRDTLFVLGGALRPGHAESTATGESLTFGGATATGTEGRAAVGVLWRRVANAPTARQFTASAVADGTIWLIGGLTANTSTTKVEGYDPAIDTWKAGPDLPLPLHHVSAVTYKGEVVVLGGWIPEGPNLTAVASDKVFALRGGAWIELPKLNRPRAAAAAAVVGNQIVVAGGQAAKAMVTETEVFDGTKWRDAAPIPTPREHLAAAGDATSAYFVGGRQLSADKNTRAVERFDPMTGKWTRMADMRTPRGGLGAALAGGKLVAVGGEDPTNVHNTVEALDLASGAWTPLPPMLISRHGMATVGIGQSLFVIGGATKPGHASSTDTGESLAVG